MVNYIGAGALYSYFNFALGVGAPGAFLFCRFYENMSSFLFAVIILIFLL